MMKNRKNADFAALALMLHGVLFSAWAASNGDLDAVRETISRLPTKPRSTAMHFHRAALEVMKKAKKAAGDDNVSYSYPEALGAIFANFSSDLALADQHGMAFMEYVAARKSRSIDPEACE